VTNLAGGVTSSNAVLTVIYPPSITAQPASLLVLPGTNVAFGFSLNGTAPFSYNWKFKGTNILDATNVIYTISSVVTKQRGQLFRGNHQLGGWHNEFQCRIDRVVVAPRIKSEMPPAM